MTTSRTGTAHYLRNARRVKDKARREGITHCPGYERRDGTHRECGRELNYDTPLLDSSAEADHVVDHQYGGGDEAANLRVLCRACNRERNHERMPIPIPGLEGFPLSRVW